MELNQKIHFNKERKDRASFILPDQDISGMFTWEKISDGIPLVNATALYGDCVIGVNMIG